MSYVPKTISEVVGEYINRTTFLPAIQREYVWETEGIEKLFDSIMGEYPISTFLFWKIKEENKHQWTAYEFIRDFDKGNPHNKEAGLAGINQDIFLVLDGQQRLTSLFVGLKGSYKYYYYAWRKTKLYLNLFKEPKPSDDPEELMYQFEFRENNFPNPKDPKPQLWYLVGNVLDFLEAEDAKDAIADQLENASPELQNNARKLIGKLHSRIHTARILNYYEEKSQDYDKVVEVFIRANTGGKKLEYSDILLSTATAKWKDLNAREEIHNFTDEINKIGNGYRFDKDFVLKGCLYLTEGLPIQYKVKNFNKTNLEKIEDNWETIKTNIKDTIKLINKYGFGEGNLISKSALLPISLFLQKKKNKNIVGSSNIEDVKNQNLIQKWFVLSQLKNTFGRSGDNVLKNLQETLLEQPQFDFFPFEALNKKLLIEPKFNEAEIENLFWVNYGTKYSYLLLSLLYPDRDWLDNKYHEDHIYPKSEFTTARLAKRGYDEAKIQKYQQYFNTVLNLQLLTDKENLDKNAADFAVWIESRDENFKKRHSIPELANYGFDNFLEFIEERRKMLKPKLSEVIG
jgi:uncharacterized protein with ParB-like and HNH nuclease domain